MDLRCQLPEQVRQRLEQRLGSGEDILHCLASDLTLSRKFGPSYIAVSRGAFAVCDADGDGESLSLEDVKEVKTDELFASASLTAVMKDGSERRLIYFTKACVPEFAVLGRVISVLAKGGEPRLPEADGRAYCPRCGGPLPERGANCPKCVRYWAMTRRIASLMAPYKGRAALMVLATLIGVLARAAPPYIIKVIVDDVIGPKDTSLLLPLIGAMVGCGVILLIAHLIRGGLMGWLSARIVADLRSRLHTHLQRMRMNYFTRHESGEIVGRVMHDTEELQDFLIDGLPHLAVEVVTLVVIAIVLLHMDVGLALIVFVPVPILLLGGRWSWKRLIPMFHRYGTRIGTLHSTLNESISGIKVVKAFAQEKRRAMKFDSDSEALSSTVYTIERTWIGFFQTMFFVMSLGTAAVWLVASWRMARGDTGLTVGKLFAFSAYIWMFYDPLSWFTRVLNWMSHAFSGAERIFALLDSPPEVYEAPDAVTLPRIHGEIEFRDVHFSYDRGKEVIKGVSLHVDEGEMIGLVGKSGAGKSTIINLICRFYEPDAGLISVDGHPIHKIRLEQLRRSIGIVMQEPFLFGASILDNLRCARPDGSFADVVRAAKAAHAHDFILAKEDGYDTVIGEGGLGLSGGERQRLSIARAILHDPPILILDEATSSVDSETEKAIQQAIANLTRNRTTIAIAHRLATLRHANRLVVIEDGRIAEIGTHDDLLAHGGIYARLVKMQTELTRLRGSLLEE